MDKVPQMESPLQLIQEIREMPEYELREQLDGFRNSIYIFQANFQELESLIQHLLDSSAPNSPSVITNPENLPHARAEVARLLHNFVAAAKSLVDHTRRLYNKMYKASGRFPDYQAQVDREFVQDPLVQFVQELREFCQHYKSPVIAIRQSFTNSGAGFTDQRTVFLQRKQLLAFDSWNATARKYLNSLGQENIDILAVTGAYREKITTFYHWFMRRQAEIHAEELGRLHEKKACLDALEVESSLNSCLNNLNIPDVNLCDEQNAFFPVSTMEFIQDLSKVGDDRIKRAARAIELLQARFPVSDRLKEKVERYYREYWSLAPH
jgi:hypothetical protein